MTNGADVRELLNAHLDGELDDAEQARLDAALRADPALTVELRELAATRALLRGLGPVEPLVDAARADDAVGERPTAVVSLEGARRRRSATRAVAAIASVAAGWLVVASIGAAVGRPAMAPDVDALASIHRTDTTEGFESADAAMLDDPAFLDDLGDLDLEMVMRKGDVVLTRYSDGASDLSVFRQPGRVDWSALPADGTMQEFPAGKTWQRSDGSVVVVVAERGDHVVTVVSDAAMGEMASEAPSMIPELAEQKSLWERLRRGPGDLLDRLGN